MIIHEVEHGSPGQNLIFEPKHIILPTLSRFIVSCHRPNATSCPAPFDYERPIALLQFCQHLIQSTNLEQIAGLMGLHYMAKIVEENPYVLDTRICARCLLTTCMLIATKFVQEVNTLQNSDWANIAGLNLDYLNSLERDVLCLLRFDLNVSEVTLRNLSSCMSEDPIYQGWFRERENMAVVHECGTEWIGLSKKPTPVRRHTLPDPEFYNTATEYPHNNANTRALLREHKTEQEESTPPMTGLARGQSVSHYIQRLETTDIIDRTPWHNRNHVSVPYHRNNGYRKLHSQSMDSIVTPAKRRRSRQIVVKKTSRSGTESPAKIPLENLHDIVKALNSVI